MASVERVTLRDGRTMDVRVSGPTDGVPLVFHHGTPGAAVPFRAMERAAHERGLRLLSFSRPGYGTSTRLPGRSVADVVTDTSALLEWMGAHRCLVAGWSGGGPHALACGARLEAAAAVVVIAGVAPYDAAGLDWTAGMGEDNVAEFSAAVAGETALRSFLEEVGAHLKDVSVDGIISSLSSLLPDVDRAVLTDEFGQDMADSFHEALRHGVDGWLDDDLAFIRPWGFEIDEVARPLAIWQGSDDLMVPYGHGQWLAASLPDAVGHLQEGEGHLSVGVGSIGPMLDELLELGAY